MTVSPSLSFIPLGGLGEIGMNMMVLEYGNDALLIDCGVMFPESVHYGIDLIIPDFRYILKIKHKIRALLLTHGHEDHIGGVPYFLKHLNPPIYGSEFTLALLEAKLLEHNLHARSRLRVVYPNQKVTWGSFTAEFLQVSHSIIEGMGLAIHTPEGIVIHTSDFKIDDDPYHGKKITLKKFEDYGKRGVLLLLSDSTNVEREGKSLSEEQIKHEIFKLFKKAPGRVIFSVFATNIRRIEQVLEIAKKLNKRVVLSGRSIEKNVEIAKQHGFLSPQTAGVLADLDDLSELKPEKTVVVCTGSQAEFGSALWRMSLGEHRQVKINERDTVILSSRFIPGNEKAISHLINDLCRQGAKVFYDKVASVHVSGHAYAGELRRMIKAVNPRFFIPIHGEYRHLVRHAELAQEMNISPERIFVCENGDRVFFQQGKARRTEPIAAPQVFVDGKNTREIETLVLKDRHELSETGVIFAVLVRNKKDQSIISGPNLFSKGVLDRQHQDLLKRAQGDLSRFFKKSSLRAMDLEEEIRLYIRRFFKKAFGKKPVVVPLVIEL